ncbi:unnamed protein product [Staurois parvus]|uniref:Secreted protein n=1 Tax=Staurois parvus TaxID=386267 RepID=A0ABN9BA02_9NEOB|nr:unnamed protein product [Staurois parvus]
MGPRTAWSRCCWAHSVTWGPCTPPPIAPTLPCATFRSPHTPAGFHFVIVLLGCCMASHLLLPPTATLWLQTLGFGHTP